MREMEYKFYYEDCSDPEEISINEPNQCPMCKNHIKPNYLYGWVAMEAKTAYAVFECRACFRVFMKSIEYLEKSSLGYLSEGDGSCSYLTPNPSISMEFSNYINDISPQFVEIYNQANAAECYALNEIAGIGYRKSIEFLIKDYLISNLETEEEKDNIKKKFLGKCINEDIDNPNLKKVASRAVWIGNDETHYIRKHTDRDITDLKRLIDITVRWIETECMTREAEEEIQPM